MDLQTNNPRKLFRAITDLFEDEISKRGYGEPDTSTPKLKGTGVEGVADFEGFVEVRKIHHIRTKKRIILGLIVILVGIPAFLISNSAFAISTNLQSTFFNFIWIIPIIIGITIILSRRRTDLIIGLDMEGEGYQYKGKKQTLQSETKRERLDVLSDVRLTLSGETEQESYINEMFKTELERDVQFINEQLEKIVPEYRIPN